jgi:hypothetical protein
MTIRAKTTEYYDWFEDLEPIVLDNLNEILVSKGIDPLSRLHGGMFKDGKWVSIGEGNDYRNYWHLYLDLWGERVRNDSYDEACYPWCDDDEEWEYWYEKADKFCDVKRSGYVHSDPQWGRDLVTAIRKLCKDHNLYDGVLIKWCW